MSLDTQLLTQTFEVVIERQPQLTTRFYEILFERHPQAKPLFGEHSGERQARMLQDALVAVIEHLEDAPWLAENLGTLGARHDAYGVTREMYDWVGDALLTTLEEVAGDDWTPAVARAWTDAYGAIAGLMQAGSAHVGAA